MHIIHKISEFIHIITEIRCVILCVSVCLFFFCCCFVFVVVAKLEYLTYLQRIFLSIVVIMENSLRIQRKMRIFVH